MKTVYPFIEAEKRQAASGNVKRACELLKVSRAAYYARTRQVGGPSPREPRDAELTDKIVADPRRPPSGTYGSPRVHA